MHFKVAPTSSADYVSTIYRCTANRVSFPSLSLFQVPRKHLTACVSVAAAADSQVPSLLCVHRGNVLSKHAPVFSSSHPHPPLLHVQYCVQPQNVRSGIWQPAHFPDRKCFCCISPSQRSEVMQLPGNSAGGWQAMMMCHGHTTHTAVVVTRVSE